jgi:hypothetical protein
LSSDEEVDENLVGGFFHWIQIKTLNTIQIINKHNW